MEEILASLHDATFLSVDVRWTEARVVCHVQRVAVPKNVELIGTSFTSVNAPRKQPWGPSRSVNNAKHENGRLVIELQSGDVIEIAAEQFEFALS
jgi:hypothetical protein